MSLFLSNVIACCCGVVLILVAAVCSVRNRKLSDFWFIMAISQFPSALVGYVLNSLAATRSIRIDLYLNYLDGFFRHPSNHLAYFLNEHSLLHRVVAVDYLYWWIPVWIALISLSLRDVSRAWLALSSALLSGILAIPFYLLFPACGPYFMAPGFPAIYSGQVHMIVGTVSDMTNCIPSVHFTMALMVLWFLRDTRWGMAIGIAHLGLTALATLGLGEHYFVDLLFAIPFTWLVVSVPEFFSKPATSGAWWRWWERSPELS